MKYLFILGRNIELSELEVESYFEKEGNKILSKSLKSNGILIELENPLEKRIINFFGGVLSIGKVLSGIEEMDYSKIYLGTSNKLNYALWNFSEKYNQVENYLKKLFREEKLKATLKHLTGKIKLQEGGEAFIPSSKLLDEEYFVFENYFGKIIEYCDYDSIEKRDMEKPVRRESLAISPRLAKILVNLSGAKKGEKLLDPFCGVGTILQEALLQEVKVVGVDRDSKAIDGAKKNMRWFGFDQTNYELINYNSTEVSIPEVNCVATEPDLGETLKKIPTKDKAKKTIQSFEELIVKVINNMKENVKGKIVFTSPYIRIGKKRLFCDIESICERTGYSLVGKGIPEYRGKQVIGRMIFILEK